jgi:hypothetical protein
VLETWKRKVSSSLFEVHRKAVLKHATVHVCSKAVSIRAVALEYAYMCTCVSDTDVIALTLCCCNVYLQEKRIAIEAGMGRYEEEEQDRVEFQGEVIRSPVDGRCVCTYSNTHIYCMVTVDLVQ